MAQTLPKTTIPRTKGARDQFWHDLSSLLRRNRERHFGEYTADKLIVGCARCGLYAGRDKSLLLLHLRPVPVPHLVILF